MPSSTEAPPAPEKLQLLKSPLSNDLEERNMATGFQQALGPQVAEELGYSKDASPTLLRYSEATNLETFYDLFLAAVRGFHLSRNRTYS